MAETPKQPAKPAEPKELGKPALTTQQVGCLRFSACGNLLAGGDYDAKVQLWRVKDAELSPLPALSEKHNGWVDALAFAPKEELLFTADTWGRLSCWEYAAWLNEPTPDLATIKPRWSNDAAHDGFIRQIAVSLDGKHLAICGRDQVVRLWSLDGKLKHELKEHREDVYAVAFSPDSTTLVTGDIKGTIRVWSVDTGKHERQLDAASLYKIDRIQDVGGARVLCFSRDGTSLYCGGALPKSGGFVEATPKLLRFDFKSGKLEQELTLGDPPHGFVYEIIDHPAGYLMLITSGQPGNGKLFLLKPGENAPLYSTNAMPNTHALAAHPDGKRFAVASTNGNSNVNGRQGSIKNGVYTGNHSPIHLWLLPA
jgi:WD40 repeat protein